MRRLSYTYWCLILQERVTEPFESRSTTTKTASFSFFHCQEIYVSQYCLHLQHREEVNEQLKGTEKSKRLAWLHDQMNCPLLNSGMIIYHNMKLDYMVDCIYEDFAVQKSCEEDELHCFASIALFKLKRCLVCAAQTYQERVRTWRPSFLLCSLPNQTNAIEMNLRTLSSD